eukprot:scaffold14912_cov308-Ochromonas_danica.AAC.1
MRGRLLSGELAAMPRLVAVRPDGHIAASLPLRQEDGEEQVKAFCQTLASSLGLPLGGADWDDTFSHSIVRSSPESPEPELSITNCQRRESQSLTLSPLPPLLLAAAGTVDY